MSDPHGGAVSDGDVKTSEALDVWLDRLAQADGAPGGGAACGVMLAVAAALLRMVALYTSDDERATQSAARLVASRREALRAAEADGMRSAALGAAVGAAPDSPGRDRSVRDAAVAAAASSATLGQVGADLLPELELLARIGNPNVTADLVGAAHALIAGVAGALVNLRGDVELAARHADAGEEDAEWGELTTAAGAMEEVREAASAIAGTLSAKFAPSDAATGD